MPQTLTVVHTPIGGAAAATPEVSLAVSEAAQAALADAAVTDARAVVGSGMLSVVLLHGAGEGDSDVHRVAWNALDAGTSAARAVGVPGLGNGLPVDAFHGSLRNTGLSVAELVLTERPVGPVVVLLSAGASLGALNRPLSQAFADPFTTPRLVESPALRRGFIFEVHDLEEPRKRMFAAPAELHDLLACLAESDRYFLQRVVTAEGAVVAVTSSARRADVLGPSAEDDVPVAVVRTGGDAPTVEELLGALRVPQIVRLPGGAIGPHEVRALAFHIAGDRLLEPADLLGHTSSAGGRGKARNLAGLLRAQGPFAPRAVGPLAEIEAEAADPSGGDPGRWSER